MAPKYITFRVRGHGYFPTDMLRYDNCWPADSESVLGLDYDREDTRAPRIVKLTMVRHHVKDGPRVDRWESFGWPVVSIEKAH